MSKRVHFPSLDGIRAAAILMVVIYHTVWFYPGKPPGIHSPMFQALGPIGVKIFFCLSGYLITRLLLMEEVANSRISLSAFYKRRAVRILPIALVYIVVVLFLFKDRIATSEYLCAVLFLEDFRPNPTWALGHLWSLSVEQQFYLFWPLVFMSKRRRVPVLIGVIFAVQLVNLALYKFSFFLSGQAFYTVADTMAAGCLIAVYREHPRVKKLIGWPGLQFIPVAAILLLMFFFTPASAHFNYPYILVRTIITPVCYLCLAASIDHFVAYPIGLLNLGFIQYLGKISYSMYLCQQLFCYYEQTARYSRHGLWIDVAITMGLILIASIISYELIEKPSLKLRRLFEKPAER